MGKGLSPRIRVAAPTGATITGTLGGDTVSFTEKSTGVYEADVEKLGPWNLTGTKGAKADSTVVSVDDVGLFEGEMAFVSTTLNDNDWETISAVSQAGTGANYWSIGDAKEITLNGYIGTKAYIDVKLYVFILHFNLPDNKSVADNNIIWGGFKTALTGGKDICLLSAKYSEDDGWSGYTDGTKQYNINHWGESNGGGWKSCDLRYDILGAVETQPGNYGKKHQSYDAGYDATVAAFNSPKSSTLMAAIPADFRSVLRLWNRWIDANGSSSNVDENIQKIVDAGISLPTEFEVFGSRTFANQYEQNHQTQFAYYDAGNDNNKYKYSVYSITVKAYWWCSSPVCNTNKSFCNVAPGTDTGGADGNYVSYSLGLAPVFKT